MQIYMMAFDSMGSRSNIYYEFSNLLPQIFDVIFPAESVKDFHYIHQHKEPAADKQFRTHFLTRLSSFLGLPNRKLHENSVQSWQNLLDVFTGKQENASIIRNRIRAAIIPLNILLVFLKLPLNIIKIITEFIPACLCVITLLTFGKIFELLIYSIFGELKHDWLLIPFALILSPILLPPQIMYFAGCCLTSAYESMKSAWIFGAGVTHGIDRGWIFGTFLVAVVIAGTAVMYIAAFPITAKLLIPKIAPFIAHYIPQSIVSGLDKFGAIIKPTLSAIGSVLAPIIKYSQMALMQIYSLPFLNSLSTVPALVGAGLFVGIAVATIGPVINHYLDKFKPWWNYDPPVEQPSDEEGQSSDEMSQQCKMLCALRESEETQPLVIVHELPKIIECTETTQISSNHARSNNSLILRLPGGTEIVQLNSAANNVTKSPDSTSSNLFQPPSSTSKLPPQAEIRSDGTNKIIHGNTLPMRRQ